MQSLQAIKNQVFAALQTKATEAVKQWAEAHGLEVDLRTKQGWLTVASTIARIVASQVKEQAMAAAKAINEADVVELNDRICNEARALKVAVVDGTIDAYATLKQHWGPTLRFSWHCLRIVMIGVAIASLYCLRAGQQLRDFVDEFEYTGLAPHQIAWALAKPAARQGRKMFYSMGDRLQVWALNRTAEAQRFVRLRRVRDFAIQFTGAVAIAASTSVIG